jgi:hypothetical protein
MSQQQSVLFAPILASVSQAGGSVALLEELFSPAYNATENAIGSI